MTQHNDQDPNDTNDTNDTSRERPGAEHTLDALLGELRSTYNAPPAPPLEAMWAAIETSAFDDVGTRDRAGESLYTAPRLVVGGSTASIAPRRRPFRYTSWIGIAAALVAGIGIGRVSAPDAGSSATPVVASSVAGIADGASADTGLVVADAGVYEQSVSRHLGQTAALLIALPRDGRSVHARTDAIARASELLTSTRLLLDSPAANQPETRALLEDLELVLAQVVGLESVPGREEMELIRQALEQRELLPRLHTAVSTSSGADD